MQLHIRVGFDTYILEVKHFTTIDHVKVLLAIRISITPDATYQLCVSCCGKMIRDDEIVGNLESYNVDITVHLPGGKVHGSLARAGKVRSQTVKVEKKEKHKPKTGRAKRRQQFNRRFAQSAAAGGHQRPQGPNSQRGK